MPVLLLLPLFLPVLFPAATSGVHALAQPPQRVLVPKSQAILLETQQSAKKGAVQYDSTTRGAPARVFSDARPPGAQSSTISGTLEDLLSALDVMQDEYFEVWLGTWPTSIDWTAAVMGTHVSATLAALTAASDGVVSGTTEAASEDWQLTISRNSLAFENLINYFADQIQSFYFGENAFSLRHQAYDDMLWVVLGWLENIEFQELHQELHYSPPVDELLNTTSTAGHRWHGTQYRKPAAHRARIFYDLASAGWDETLCGGGMIWNPNLVPYKNAITNELFISASIAMYLYFPGDPIDSPYVETKSDAAGEDRPWKYLHDPAHLEAAVNGYEWLKRSNMTTVDGLYADGFHISGWRSSAKPGSRKCDVLNTMVYTYNQGVILSGLRGLWLATASEEYIRDGHELVGNVMDATGWPDISDTTWAGLGRGGVLEEACDSWGSCSQDGQTFKGIFFHHLAEFCRPVRPQEQRFVDDRHVSMADDWEDSVDWHRARCRSYRPWIEHNARAALVSRDERGKFGTWWGRKYRTFEAAVIDSSWLPDGAVDYRNPEGAVESKRAETRPKDYNDRGRGRTVETQAGGLAVLRALFQWLTSESLS